MYLNYKKKNHGISLTLLIQEKQKLEYTFRAL